MAEVRIPKRQGKFGRSVQSGEIRTMRKADTFGNRRIRLKVRGTEDLVVRMWPRELTLALAGVALAHGGWGEIRAQEAQVQRAMPLQPSHDPSAHMAPAAPSSRTTLPPALTESAMPMPMRPDLPGHAMRHHLPGQAMRHRAFATLRRPLDWTFQVQVKGQDRTVPPIYK